MQKIDLDTWYRKEQFEFYSGFSQPFFNVCASVDVSHALAYCQKNQLSFFICSLFLLGYTANQIEAFRLRINHNEVIIHQDLEISCTVLNKDDSFSFCDFGSCDNFDAFYHRAEQQLTKVKNGYKSLKSVNTKHNKLFCSVLPWLHFTSFSHAQKQDQHDSIPRIVMGKYQQNQDHIAMPVSVEVHHALVDGLHVGQYFEKLQQNFDNFAYIAKTAK